MVLLPCAYDIYYDYAVLFLISAVLERGSIDKFQTFDVGLIQLNSAFIPVCSPNTCNISVKLR